MRQLKYANSFSPSSEATRIGEASENGMTASPVETVTQPRERRSGADTSAAVAASSSHLREYADDSDIFSDAISEAEDSSVANAEDPIVDYPRLHRASFIKRPPKPDYAFKVCIVGDVNVGKTSLLLSIADQQTGAIPEEGGNNVAGSCTRQTPKVGIAGREKLVYSSAKGKTVKCRLEDTAGQERYKSLTSSFYRNCFGCLVVYDVTREETFNHVDGWMKDIQMYGEAEISVVLVAAFSFGSFNDATTAAEALNQRRVVTVEEGEKKAEQFEVPYVEANVRRGPDAVKALEKLVDEMIGKLEKRRSKTPIPERYQSPDPRRSYRPSTVTRKSVVAIANADKAAKASAHTVASPAATPKVRLAPTNGRGLEESERRTNTSSSCC